MKIRHLELNENMESGQSFVTASARVIFEDCDQPEKTVFIRTPKEQARGFHANGDAFLTGCLVPAIHFREKRISIEGQVCPLLKEGLSVVMGLFSHWYKDRFPPIVIEADSRRAQPVNGPFRAGMVMSGGMDSLAALRLNQLHYPQAHPARVKDCFFLHGFDIGGVRERGLKYHVYDRAIGAISKVTRDAGTELVPVYTNIRHLCDERQLWLSAFYASVLAAMAHSFSGRVNMMSIGSSNDIPNLYPCASHPLVDPEYSSYAVRIRHRDYQLMRLEKIKIVSEWEPAFQNFRVCLANVPDRLNCGKCEKCVRTMTELTALGLLHKTRAFEADEVRPEDIDRYDIRIRLRPPFYEPMIPLLRERGRHDLADLIEHKLKPDA